MSTEANAALAWPVEITEFAYIGDQVADELSRESRESSSETEAHFAWILWTLDTEDVPLFSLLGTTWPGKLYAYSPWRESRVSDRVSREFAQLYADAGFYELPPRLDILVSEAPSPLDMPVLVPRRCVGDPSMDPTVLTEGCWVPWLVPAPLWDSMEDPGRTTGDVNEPDDYDGYVDYVTGKVPGLDGVTYVDGSRGDEG
jgi:hypothetical protein